MIQKNTEIAIVSHTQTYWQELSTALKGVGDIWFLANDMDPRIMIHKALLDMKTVSLHLLGKVEAGCFRVGNSFLKADDFPQIETNGNLRFIILWVIDSNEDESINSEFMSGLQVRTGMSIYTSIYAPDRGRVKRLYTPPLKTLSL